MVTSPPPAPRARPLPPPGPPILIVDDNQANLMALEAVLEPLDVPVLRAVSGEDALRELLKHGESIAVMLLDVHMPGLDGFETARLVRGRATLRHLPIIFMTAVSREEAHIVRGYAHDAVDYILKPFNPEVLRAKVKFFVELHRRSLALARTRIREEQRLALVLEAAELGSWTWEATTGEVDCDDRCRALLGVSAEQDVGLEAFCVEDPNAVSTDARLRVEYPGPSGRWLLAQGRAYRDQHGVARIIGVLADITDDKRIQTERELFLGALGHDLRDPLNAIGMAAHLLSTHADDAVVGPASRISSAGTRMARLIGDLLDFVRSRSGDLRLERHDVDLSSICREVIAEQELAHLGRSFHLETAPDAIGRWDAGRVAQVVQNLVANAIHHGDPTEPVRVRVKATDALVELEVENAGEPIPADMRARIFEPYVRPGSQGLGLGLYIVRQLVLAHGGEVDVSSAGGKTTFFARLPRRPQVSEVEVPATERRSSIQVRADVTPLLAGANRRAG